MFDIGSFEFILFVLVVVLVIPPKDFPKVLRFVVDLFRRVKSFITHISSEISEIIDETGVNETHDEFKKEIRKIKSEINSKKSSKK